MERCRRCVLPKSFVSHSPDGICALCLTDTQEQDAARVLPEEVLTKKLEHIKAQTRKRGGKYDCMVAISGGMDSMYVLYQAVRKHGLRALAFSYDHGFLDEQARRNTERATAELGVDLVWNKRNSLHHRYLRHNIAKLPSRPSRSLAALAQLLCVGCREGYILGGDETARRHGVPLILQGSGYGLQPDMRDVLDPWKNKYVTLLLKPLAEMASCPGMFWNPFYYKNLGRHLRVYGLTAQKYLGRIMPRKAPEFVREQFYRYGGYDFDKIIETLEKELGWRRPANRSSPSRFDCKLHYLRERLCYVSVGATDKVLQYAEMVRKDVISREDALRRIEREEREEAAIWDDLVRDVLRTIGADDQFDRLKRLCYPAW